MYTTIKVYTIFFVDINTKMWKKATMSHKKTAENWKNPKKIQKFSP